MRARRRLALLLGCLALLTACAPAGEPAASGTPPASMPTPTPKQTPAAAPELGGAVYADWSQLAPYEPPEEIFTRLTDAPLMELVPADDYGPLMPFSNSDFHSNDRGGEGSKVWGLVTAEGMIVMDPVCVGIRRLDPDSYGDDYHWGRTVLVLGQNTDGSAQIFALAASDGSWVTEYQFENISFGPDGVIGVLAESAGHGICYTSEGEILFDTRDFLLESTDGYTLYNCSEGFATVWAGGYGGAYRFVDYEGVPLASAECDGYFEWADSFSEGRAVVRVDGRYGYLKTDGTWLVEPQYREASAFVDGFAIVSDFPSGGEEWVYVLNLDGQICARFQGQYGMVFRTASGLMFGVAGYVGDQYQRAYYGEDFDLLRIRGELPQMFYGQRQGFFYLEAIDGIWLLWEGEEVFLQGAQYVNECVNGWFSAFSDERGMVLFAASGEAVFASGPDSYFSLADIGGETYLVDGSSRRVLRTDGTVVVTNAESIWSEAGLVQCRDSLTTGLKNLDNEWVFRITMASNIAD